jgi:hypothetical protein
VNSTQSCLEVREKAEQPVFRTDCGQLEHKKTKWCFRTSAVVVGLLCVGPLALPLVWFNPRYKGTTKVIATGAVVLLTALLCCLTAKVCNMLIEQLEALRAY